MAHYFAQPIKPTQSLRARRHAPPRKRQRLDDDDSDSQDSDKGRDPSPESSTRATPAISTLSAAAARQFRTAGHDPDFELPLDPFPHAPTNVTVPKLLSSEIQQKLAKLKPPLFAPGLSHSARITEDFTPKTSSFRQHHLGVLTTVMHHCLLKGDYQRAGRAWGMILRGETDNTTLDIRHNARWAIGAEVLLRANRVDGYTNRSTESPRHELFSVQGFQAARNYYERIILQFPFQQHAPQATNALTFYPAMFSLWIYQVSQEASLAKEGLENEELELSEHDSEIESRSDDSFARQSRKREAKLAAIRADELRRAQEIASRLDELMTSPPFDKNVDLLQLRGMTAVWISDLLKDGLASDDDEIASNHDVSLPGQGMKHDASARQAQIGIAKTMFKGVKSNGGHLKESAEQFLAEADN